MDKAQKVLLISLISISAITWFASTDKSAMNLMMNYDSLTILLFAVSWTIGMAAMMFPAISPMVLLYSRLVQNNSETGLLQNLHVFKLILFVGTYLAVWALTGIVLALAWSVAMNSIQGYNLEILYAVVLLVSGAYQFSPLKTKCLGYCQSPMHFFLTHWRNGTVGTIKLGTFHGLYCLGCCWPYFLLLVALGSMNLLWMGLFAGIIFGEKVWSRGVGVARASGIAFMMMGLFTLVMPHVFSIPRMM